MVIGDRCVIMEEIDGEGGNLDTGGWRRGGDIQFFAPHEMLVIIEEIVSSLAPWSCVDPAVFTGLRRGEHAEGAGEGFRGEVLRFGIFVVEDLSGGGDGAAGFPEALGR